MIQNQTSRLGRVQLTDEHLRLSSQGIKLARCTHAKCPSPVVKPLCCEMTISLSAVEHRSGVDVRMVNMGDASLDRTADYLAKITSEIVSPLTKDGRDGNRAPFAILRGALASGLADGLGVVAASGRRSATTSGSSPGTQPARVGRAARRAPRRGGRRGGPARRRSADHPDRVVADCPDEPGRDVEPGRNGWASRSATASRGRVEVDRPVRPAAIRA